MIELTTFTNVKSLATKYYINQDPIKILEETFTFPKMLPEAERGEEFLFPSSQLLVSH